MIKRCMINIVIVVIPITGLFAKYDLQVWGKFIVPHKTNVYGKIISKD